jgi:hypothetical protein
VIFSTDLTAVAQKGERTKHGKQEGLIRGIPSGRLYLEGFDDRFDSRFLHDVF